MASVMNANGSRNASPFSNIWTRRLPSTSGRFISCVINVSTHHGKEVTRWFAKHPRFVVHFTPVHCSWMNQVEQWFSILQRKRLRIVDFISKDHLRVKLEPFIREWNQQAHPFNWSTKSVAKVMAEAPALAA